MTGEASQKGENPSFSYICPRRQYDLQWLYNPASLVLTTVTTVTLQVTAWLKILMPQPHTVQCVLAPQEGCPLLCFPGHCYNHQNFTLWEYDKSLDSSLHNSNPTQNFKGFRELPKALPWIPRPEVFKDNLPELENIKMPVLLQELKVHSVKTSTYGWRGEGEEKRQVLMGSVIFFKLEVFWWRKKTIQMPGLGCMQHKLNACNWKIWLNSKYKIFQLYREC